ncbi:argonaute 5 [Tyrophagus putrescentiae]|nr:argonaute 5 [Tyrophagus putrescentiae]
MDSTSAPSSGRGPTSAGGDKSTAEADTIMVQLLANYYKITTADVVVVHYDVEITKAESDQFAKKAPAGPSKNETETAVVEAKKTKNKAFVRFFSGYSNDIIKALITANQAIFKDLLYVWDGQRNLFTTRLLNLSGGDEQVFNNLKVEIPGGRPSFFKLKVKRVSRVDLSEMTSFYDMKTGEINNRVLSIFEIVFRFMCTGPFESHRQKFFDINTRRPLGFKASLADFVNGFISSLRITEFGLALNGHLKAAGLITKSFTTLPLMVASLAGVRDLDRPDQLELVPEWKWQEINQVLRRLKIFTSHTKRRMFYTVDRLMPGDTPQRMTLQLPDEQEMTIAAYFQTIYGINLQKAAAGADLR